MWLLIAFIAVPLIEIALFIQVGGFIGLWPTLLIVIATAIAGTYLVRSQGRMALSQLQRSFNDLRDPTEPLVHGAMILFSGALLLTPGFFTDAVGFRAAGARVPAGRVPGDPGAHQGQRLRGAIESPAGPTAARPRRCH